MSRIAAGVILALALGQASAQSFGDWRLLGQEGNVRSASTTNDSGAILMKMCRISENNCYWFIYSKDTTCKVGDVYPGLMNNSEGAAPLELACSRGQDILALNLGPFETMQTAVKQGGVLGIVVPVNDGAFRVLRFNMTGASRASELLEKWLVEQQSKSTRNYDL